MPCDFVGESPPHTYLRSVCGQAIQRDFLAPCVRGKTEERFEMEVLVIVIHAVAALLLAGVILLQSGKGGGMGAGFGGASSAATNIFGGRGATGFLGQATVGLAATFMFTSLTLAYMSAKPQTQMDLTETDGATQAQEDEIVEAGAAGAVAPAEKPAEIVPVELPATDIPVEPTEVIEEPAIEVVPAEAPAEKPAAEKPAAEKPAAEKPAAEKPAVEKPAAEKPAAEKPAAEKPAAEAPAAE